MSLRQGASNNLKHVILNGRQAAKDLTTANACNGAAGISALLAVTAQRTSYDPSPKARQDDMRIGFQEHDRGSSRSQIQET